MHVLSVFVSMFVTSNERKAIHNILTLHQEKLCIILPYEVNVL